MYYYNPFTFNGNSYNLFDYFFPNRWFIPACLPIMLGALSAVILFYKQNDLRTFFDYKLVWLAIPLFFAQLLLKDLNFVIIETFQPIAFIGKISYGLYVYQGLFLRTGPGGTLSIQKFPLNIVLVIITAVMSYYLLEKPILKFKNQFKLS